MNERSIHNRAKSPEEVYRKLTLASFHYHHLFTKDQRKLMRYVFANCTLGKIIKSGDIRLNRIANFYSYEEYYLYLLDDRELEFMHKSDINIIMRQVKLISLKGFDKYKHLRN